MYNNLVTTRFDQNAPSSGSTEYRKG